MLVTTLSGSFEINEGESLLESLEKHGYTVEYQCKNGYCGACRLGLKKGRVEYKTPPLAFMQENELLACCCIVKEDLWIEISYLENLDQGLQENLFDEN
ncbi:MAG: class I ribonucleotide reductase maintenance protein YfaE [Neisseriaceae bacterium]